MRNPTAIYRTIQAKLRWLVPGMGIKRWLLVPLAGATLLRAREAEPSLVEFLKLGAVAVPPALVLGTVGLWLGLQVIG